MSEMKAERGLDLSLAARSFVRTTTFNMCCERDRAALPSTILLNFVWVWLLRYRFGGGITSGCVRVSRQCHSEGGVFMICML